MGECQDCPHWWAMLLNLAVPIIIVVLRVDHDIRGFYVFHVFECG